MGVVGGERLLDLAYVEDKVAEVDSNVVMVYPDRFVEVQGTGEQGTFSRQDLDALMDLAQKGIGELFRAQQKVLELA